MNQQTPDKPKPRVSLVGEDDLKKMREEEGQLQTPSSFQHRLFSTIVFDLFTREKI